jgi:hypothetical protein
VLAAGVGVAIVAPRQMAADRPTLLTPTVVAAPEPSDAAALAHELLESVVHSPPTRLPRALIDPGRGVARSNLQSICHRAPTDGYLCVVRRPVHKPGEGLYVRYGPNGFVWYPYRPG